MKCPSCQVDNDRVIDSRASHDGFATRRRRECLNCRHRYTTYERIEGTTIKVVKKDGTREPFDRLKIKLGLEKACWKRPVSESQLEAVVSAVENEVEGRFESEVPSDEVGEVVMQHLRKLDQVAYVRFASVYRQFEDVHDFVHELKPMLDEERRGSEGEREA
ncbi:MAG: transcriptional regulator NrdR [Thermoguttaceae bacterium]|jgi:transcriptional repressor NrdR